MQLSILYVLFFLLFLPYTALANDGFSAVGVGGVILSKTDKIALQKEVLNISYDNIHVAYDFINESDIDIEALIMFPLPDYYAGFSPSPMPSVGQPKDFSVRVNGKNVPYKMQVKAFLLEKKGKHDERDTSLLRRPEATDAYEEIDVIDKLRAAGLTDEDIVATPFNSKLNLPDSAIERLKAEDILQEEQIGFTSQPEIVPNWHNRVTYIWKQVFPARKVTHVEHSYQPFISGGADAGFTSPYSDTELKQTYCLNEKGLDILRSLHKDEKNLNHYLQVNGANVRYILTTANSWKDGIRNFTLNIYAKSKDEIISVCFPAELKRKSPVLYQAKMKNFHPEKDLSVYFGNARHPDNIDTAGVAPKNKL